jgi:hypothetical protein
MMKKGLAARALSFFDPYVVIIGVGVPTSTSK